MDRKTELFNALIKNCQAGRKAEQDADIVEELRLAKESVGMLEEVILHMKPGFRRDEGLMLLSEFKDKVIELEAANNGS